MCNRTYEQEADRVTEQVMKMSTPDYTFRTSSQNNGKNLSRKCSACRMTKDKEENEKVSSISRNPTNTSNQETTGGFVRN